MVREEWLYASKYIRKISDRGMLGHRTCELKILIALTKLLLTLICWGKVASHSLI